MSGAMGLSGAAVSLAVLARAGCNVPPPGSAGEDRRERVVIEKARAAGAERILAEINIGAGELRLANSW